MRRLGLPLALLVCALAGLVFSAPAAALPGTMVCTNGPTFNLRATSGHISTPDGNSVFMWGFANANTGGNFQMPGPVLCVNQGATVTVNLTNDLSEPVSIVFPGQSAVTTTGGSGGLFTAEAAASGGTVSYSFVAGQPGTYLYESGTNPHKQIQMGLYGAIVVRPTMGTNFAYNDAATRFNPAREFLVLLHDIDPSLHAAVEQGEPYDVTTKHDRYWTINGRSFPDTLANSFAPSLPSQPYGALVQVEPFHPVSNPHPALIRYANAGMANHPLHPHGNHLRVIARDGRQLKGPSGQDTSFEQFTRTIGSGQTYDLLFKWANAENWSPSNRIPVVVPSLRNLAFKDAVTWYSGSPYLGQKGTLPTGTTSFNQCGEYYFPWHSHALNEFQNFDEGFGGLATLLRVDPPSGCPLPPPAGNPDFTIAAAPSSMTIPQGSNGTYSISVGSIDGFDDTVALSVSGLPSGATGNPNPLNVSGGSGASLLKINVAGTTAPGSYPLTITGTSGSLVHSAVVTLDVTPPPDFTLSAAPPSRSTAPGGTVFYTVEAGPLNGFSGNVNLSVVGLPADTTANFQPDNSIEGGSGQAELRVVTTGATPSNVYTLTITGQSGTLSHSVNVTLVVTGPEDFTIGASPGSRTVSPGGNANYTVSIGSLNGFAGNVSLSASGLPANSSAGFVPNPVPGGSGSSALTISTSASTPPGTYPVTITGQSGAISHSTQATLVVNQPPDFTISASPASNSATQGGSANYTVTISPQFGFNGNVSLSASGLPAGANASFNPNPIPGGLGSSTMTVSTGASTPAGSYPLTVTGQSGALSHSTQVTLVVNLAGTTQFPSVATILIGQPGGGVVGDLASATDNKYFKVEAAAGTPRVTSWFGSFSNVPNALSFLRVSYQGRNEKTCAQTVSIFRWTTSTWVQLDARSVGNTEVAIVDLQPIVGTLDEYVSGSSGPGSVRVRVNCSTNEGFKAEANMMKIFFG